MWGLTIDPNTLSPVSFAQVVCEDGVQRAAWATGRASSLLHVPAVVKVNGKSVSGFVTTDDEEESYRFLFFANPTGRNHAQVIPAAV